MKHVDLGLPARVYRAVMATGECTVHQVLAQVGRYISASSAATTVRRCWRASGVKSSHIHKVEMARMIASGRRKQVSDCLGRLCRAGKIERVRMGVYKPPRPRLHRPIAS